MVLDVIAGPAALAGLMAGDRIDLVAGDKVSAARLIEIIRASSPGTKLPLKVVRNGHPLDLNFVIGDWKQWASPAALSPAHFLR